LKKKGKVKDNFREKREIKCFEPFDLSNQPTSTHIQTLLRLLSKLGHFRNEALNLARIVGYRIESVSYLAETRHEREKIDLENSTYI